MELFWGGGVGGGSSGRAAAAAEVGNPGSDQFRKLFSDHVSGPYDKLSTPLGHAANATALNPANLDDGLMPGSTSEWKIVAYGFLAFVVMAVHLVFITMYFVCCCRLFCCKWLFGLDESMRTDLRLLVGSQPRTGAWPGFGAVVAAIDDEEIEIICDIPASHSIGAASSASDPTRGQQQMQHCSAGGGERPPPPPLFAAKPPARVFLVKSSS